MMRSRQRGSIVLTLLVIAALIGCESYSVKEEPAPQVHPLTKLTRQLVADGVHDARQGIDPRNRVIDRLGLTGQDAQNWYDILDHRRAGKTDVKIGDLLDQHLDLAPAERQQIEEVFAIVLGSSSPEALDARLIDYRASLGTTDDKESAVDAYIAVFRGIAHSYRDLQRTAIISAIHETRSNHDDRGLFRFAQHQGGTDGRFDYPPEIIESWTDFAGNTVMSGIGGAAAGASLGAWLCSPAVLFTWGIMPVVCGAGMAVTGFVLGASTYAGMSLMAAQAEYEANLERWCERQASYIVRHRDYASLCDANDLPS